MTDYPASQFQTDYMKKIFTSVFALSAILAPTAVSAQSESQVSYRLEQAVSEEYGEYFKFAYDGDGGRVAQIDEYFSMRTRVGFEYNDKGLCTRQTLFQEISGAFVPTCYYEFAYDDQDRLLTSALYNDLAAGKPNSKFELSVTEYHTYGDNGQVSEIETFWDAERMVPYSVKTFTYNEAGKLAETNEDMFAYGTTNVLFITHEIYTYNEQGNPLTVCTETSETGSRADLAPTHWMNYVYSADGNLEERYTTGRVNNPDAKLNRLVYMVDESVPASQVIYPVTPTEYRESNVYDLFKNQIVAVDEYQTDDDTGVAGVEPFFAWEYVYEENSLGVESVESQFGKTLAGATVDGDVLRLHGVLAVDGARIVDLNGRVVKSFGATGNKIDVADLASGVYVVTTTAGNAKFVR